MLAAEATLDLLLTDGVRLRVCEELVTRAGQASAALLGNSALVVPAADALAATPAVLVGLALVRASVHLVAAWPCAHSGVGTGREEELVVSHVHDGAVLHPLVRAHYAPLHLLAVRLVILPFPKLDRVDVPVLQIVDVFHLTSGEEVAGRFRWLVAHTSPVVVDSDVVLHDLEIRTAFS